MLNFTQDTPATRTGTIDLPGSLVGSQEATVTGEQMVTAHTEMMFEPETGVALKISSSQDQYVLVNGKRVLTLVDASFTMDDKSVAQLVDDYKPLALQLKLARLWLPLGGTVAGLLLIAAGSVLAYKPARRREPGDGETGAEAAKRRIAVSA